MAELTEPEGELLVSPGQHDVEIELGFTKSMGEGTYEFLRVDIRHRATLGEDENVDEFLERVNVLTDKVYTNLEEKIVEKVDELDKALGPRGRASKIHNNRK